jgi:hypothetical protein
MIQATSRKMQDFTQSSKIEKAIFCKFKWFVKDVIPKRFFSEDSHKESVFAR